MFNGFISQNVDPSSAVRFRVNLLHDLDSRFPSVARNGQQECQSNRKR